MASSWTGSGKVDRIRLDAMDGLPVISCWVQLSLSSAALEASV
ncbi:hypothetical protein [Vulcanococcus sp.]